ncbi:uncharacterized protein LOC130178726 [Seriola aureovittata]|uniref:uncharacterized protein LOC130178726 n=1 Tax=Seriola aureovittata TaxID=2871759 RepID=UPI0024BECFD6|nr:uncharacterized protein LOC130178726 [Seriola aureovittata]
MSEPDGGREISIFSCERKKRQKRSRLEARGTERRAAGGERGKEEEEEVESSAKGRRQGGQAEEGARLTLEYLNSALLSPAGKMSKPSSRLGRPGSAGSKSPSLRKELQGNRSCMLRIGERLMRAGSEGNLVQRPAPAQSQSHASSAGSGSRSNGRTQAAALEDKPAGNTSSKGLVHTRTAVSQLEAAQCDSSSSTGAFAGEAPRSQSESAAVRLTEHSEPWETAARSANIYTVYF